MSTLTDFLTGIANAIRGKTGETGSIPASSFAEKISAITTGVDTSDATAAAGDILSGKTAYVKGAKVTGNIASKTASNLSANGATVTVPAGYYPSQVSKSVTTSTQATPSISVDSAGKITASATQNAGYVSAGTKSATKQLTTQAAQTITPGTADKTITSGRYLTGTQTIKGDANLLAANIKSGVSIFGVSGSLVSGSIKKGTITSSMIGTTYVSGDRWCITLPISASKVIAVVLHGYQVTNGASVQMIGVMTDSTGSLTLFIPDTSGTTRSSLKSSGYKLYCGSALTAVTNRFEFSESSLSGESWYLYFE